MTANPMQIVEALVTNVRNLASNDGFKAIASIFDEIPFLKEQIKSKDTELGLLSAKFTSLETSHEHRVQENLEMYCTQRNKLEEEKAQFSRDISTLTANIQQRDVAAKENNRTQEVLRGQLHQIKKSLDEEKKQVVAANAVITKSQEGLKGKNTEIDNLKEALHHEKAQVSKVKSQSQDLLREKASLQQKLHSCTTRLSEIESFTTRLYEEDEALWIDRLDKVWASAFQLVESLFKEDLTEECLRDISAWKDFRGLPYLDRIIPLPESNSPAAKQMRIAAMLAILARCINLHVFQPTYLLDEENEIRRLLVRLAVADSKKESFCRAVLLSMFPEIQVKNAAQAVERVVREISWSVRKLISDNQYDRFKLGLEDVVHQAHDAWQLVQRSREKFEPIFEPRHYDDIEWQPLRLGERSAAAGKEKTMKISEQDNVLLVIFPRIYIVENNEPDPITQGVVLMKSQSAAATEEIERMNPPSPTAGRPGPRSRAIRSRTKSISLNGGNDFLSQPSPPSAH